MFVKLNAMSVLMVFYRRPDWLFDSEEIAEVFDNRAEVYLEKVRVAMRILRKMGYIEKELREPFIGYTEKELREPFIGYTITTKGKEIASNFYWCLRFLTD